MQTKSLMNASNCLQSTFVGNEKKICNYTYKSCLKWKTFSIEHLGKLFRQIVTEQLFTTPDGFSLFNKSSQLSFSKDSDETCFELFSALSAVLTENALFGKSEDTLNDVFGYFVRDNFRNNIEDAQYMTPPEVVEFMVSISDYILI